MKSEIDPIQFDDLRFRLLAAPVVGVAIGSATGMYRGVAFGQPGFWAATAWFIVMAIVIWEGNRVIWRVLRERPGWLSGPAVRLSMLAIGCLIWTAAVSVALQILWAAINGDKALNWTIVRNSAL